jgi:hypothetical protein
MSITIGPARVEGTFLDVKVLHGDKVLLKCGDHRRAGHFAEGYNRGWHAALAENEKKES